MPSDKSKGQKHYGSASVAGPVNYDPSAKPTVTLSELIAVESEDDVTAEATGGLEAEVVGADGNSVTVQLNEAAEPADLVDTAGEAGPAAYDPSSKPTIELADLSEVGSLDEVKAEITGGYVARTETTSGNIATIKVDEVPDPTTHSGSTAQLTEVSSGTDLSTETMHVTGVGPGSSQTLSEVDSGSDVSAETIRVRGRGY